MTRNPIQAWLSAHLTLVYIFLYGPILVLVALSFNKSGMPNVWTGFSLEWYAKLFANQKIITSDGNSLVVAGCATVISTVIGTLLAMGLEERRPHVATEALIAAPMIIPDIVMAISLLSFYSLIKL